MPQRCPGPAGARAAFAVKRIAMTQLPVGIWALHPMCGPARGHDDQRMNTPNGIEVSASALLEAARDFQSAAEQPGSHTAAPDALVSLEETLQVLSAAWYQLAADAVPRMADRGRARGLVGTLHDVAAGFARCARICRDGRSIATPIIARDDDSAPDREPTTERVA